MNAPGHAVLVVYRDTGAADAIDEYSRRLVGALVASGCAARYVSDGLSSARHYRGQAPWILLQYNPFSYGRGGIAPGLVRDAAALRRRNGVKLAVCVHEPWTHVYDWRSAFVNACQRAQLTALVGLADAVFGVTEALARRLRRNAVHVPVGSNLTPIALSRDAARERLGITGEFIVTLFGRDHPSRAIVHAEAAIAALTERHGAESVRVLNLGDGAPAVLAPAGVIVDRPGRLEPTELSMRLRASDLVLLPFVDGLSTRRTTLMASLAHGAPVAGVLGAGTDRVLIDHPDALLLTPGGRPAEHARAVVEISNDPVRLRGMGDAGRRLYEEHFDWPVLAGRVTAALRGGAPGF